MIQGMAERGGRVRAIVNPTSPLTGNVVEHVLPSAMVFSDEAAHYKRLYVHGYTHRRIHHAKKVYVFGDVHTNTIEGFWSLVKRGYQRHLPQRVREVPTDVLGRIRIPLQPPNGRSAYVPDVPSPGGEAYRRLAVHVSNARRWTRRTAPCRCEDAVLQRSDSTLIPVARIAIELRRRGHLRRHVKRLQPVFVFPR